MPDMPDVPRSDALIEAIRGAVIGDDEAVMGPYGLRRVTYADYTASGRSLTNISPGGPPRDGRIGQRDNLLGSRRASALDAGLGPAGCARRGRTLRCRVPG